MIMFLEILTPFLLASIGGLYSELSGYTNVALEGYISLGGFLFILFTIYSGSVLAAIAVTLILLGTVGFFQSYITEKIRANSIITGLAVNLGISGFIALSSFYLFNTKGVVSLGRESVFSTPIILLALLAPLISIVILKKTRFGLRLKTRGLNKKVLIYSGVSTLKYRTLPTIYSAILSGLGGIFLAMRLRSYTPNLAGGRGWISLVIIFLGRKSPLGIVLSCGVFSFSILLSNLLQKGGINSEIILALPYLITLIFLIVSGSSLLSFNELMEKYTGSRKKK